MSTILLLFAHFNATSWQFKGWNLHWALEPNINWYEHELNDPLYIKENEPNYLERREKFTEGVDFILAGIEGVIVARKKLSERGHLELSAGRCRLSGRRIGTPSKGIYLYRDWSNRIRARY